MGLQFATPNFWGGALNSLDFKNIFSCKTIVLWSWYDRTYGYKNIGTLKYGLLKITHGTGWSSSSSGETFIIAYNQGFRIMTGDTFRDYHYNSNGFYQGYTNGTHNSGAILGKIEGIIGSEFK